MARAAALPALRVTLFYSRTVAKLASDLPDGLGERRAIGLGERGRGPLCMVALLVVVYLLQGLLRGGLDELW